MRFRISTIILFGFFLLLLSGCAPVAGSPANAAADSVDACAVTEPVLVTPPEDAAVMNAPVEDFYYTNADGSILASAWWWRLQQAGLGQGQAAGEHALRAGAEGNKVGWFRPEGAALEISGRRLDGDAPAMEAEVPCCYPTRFQATGLYFPTPGCWQVTAKAGDEVLTFIARVEE